MSCGARLKDFIANTVNVLPLLMSDQSDDPSTASEIKEQILVVDHNWCSLWDDTRNLELIKKNVKEQELKTKQMMYGHYTQTTPWEGKCVKSVPFVKKLLKVSQSPVTLH